MYPDLMRPPCNGYCFEDTELPITNQISKFRVTFLAPGLNPAAPLPTSQYVPGNRHFYMLLAAWPTAVGDNGVELLQAGFTLQLRL
jgi:hypothetical protein